MLRFDYPRPATLDEAFTLKGVATRYIENLVNNGIAGIVPVNTVGVNGGQASTPKWIFRASATW